LIHATRSASVIVEQPDKTPAMNANRMIFRMGISFAEDARVRLFAREH
jgi:hypothetical protein